MALSHRDRSLAELAGERDRALRSLAAEEDKRHDLVEECSTLLGGELSCGDVSRLALSLDRIEQELEQELEKELGQELEKAGEGEGEREAGGGDRDGQPGGRKWVLEVGFSRSFSSGLRVCARGFRLYDLPMRLRPA